MRNISVPFFISPIYKIYIQFLYYISVSAYRKGNTNTDKAEPFNLDSTQFSNIFSCVFSQSLENVRKNKFRNMKRSVNGRNIIDIITKIQENEDVLSQLASYLEPRYHEVFN